MEGLRKFDIMSNFKIVREENGEYFETLKDILPLGSGKLKVLFIAKTPALKSVEAGHYFQGHHGKMFWTRLVEYGVIKVKPKTFEDENLLENGCGLTDIVKRPRDYGDEPSKSEYKEGLERILDIIDKHNPDVIIFAYKKVLDNILKWGYLLRVTSVYGFNDDLSKYFNSRVFVFPMPGTPCTSSQAAKSMTELKNYLRK